MAGILITPFLMFGPHRVYSVSVILAAIPFAVFSGLNATTIKPDDDYLRDGY